jgi:hypothetical protein
MIDENRDVPEELWVPPGIGWESIPSFKSTKAKWAG